MKTLANTDSFLFELYIPVASRLVIHLTFLLLSYEAFFTFLIMSVGFQFPDVAATVIPVLLEFLSDTNELAASDVLVFVREAIQKFDHLRPLIIEVCWKIIGNIILI